MGSTTLDFDLTVPDFEITAGLVNYVTLDFGSPASLMNCIDQLR